FLAVCSTSGPAFGQAPPTNPLDTSHGASVGGSSQEPAPSQSPAATTAPPASPSLVTQPTSTMTQPPPSMIPGVPGAAGVGPGTALLPANVATAATAGALPP